MSTSYTPGSGSDSRKGDGAAGDGRSGPADHRADAPPAREERPAPPAREETPPPRSNDARSNDARPTDAPADETPTRVHEPVRDEHRTNARSDSERHELDPDYDRTDRHRTDRDRTVDGATAGATAGAAGGAVIDRQSNVAREKEAYGGMKIGSAFFGWLTATGTAVLLTALVAAIATAVGMSMNVNADEATQNPQALQITGAILLAVVLFVAYFAGGYVAGRMARFDGAKQGVAVWLWAVAVAIIVAVVSAIAGSQFNILANINSFPRLPVNEGAMTTTGIIALVIAAAVTLIGAILGGMTGMRYHRKVDRAGFDLENERRLRR